MLINNLVDQYVQKEETFSFRALPMSLKAIKDFKYLASQTNLLARDVLEFVSIYKTNEKIGDVIVTGVDIKDGVAKIPQSLVDITVGNQYVSVVLYDGEQIIDVYVFPVSVFKDKAGMFSCFKNDAKHGMYTVNMSKPAKISEYKFGMTFREYIG